MPDKDFSIPKEYLTNPSFIKMIGNLRKKFSDEQIRKQAPEILRAFVLKESKKTLKGEQNKISDEIKKVKGEIAVADKTPLVDKTLSMIPFGSQIVDTAAGYEPPFKGFGGGKPSGTGAGLIYNPTTKERVLGVVGKAQDIAKKQGIVSSLVPDSKNKTLVDLSKKEKSAADILSVPMSLFYSAPEMALGMKGAGAISKMIHGFSKLMPFTQKLAGSEMAGALTGAMQEGVPQVKEGQLNPFAIGRKAFETAGLFGLGELGIMGASKIKSGLTDIKYPTKEVTRYDKMKPFEPIPIERVTLDIAAQYKILEAMNVPKSMYPQMLESDKFKFLETFGQNIVNKILKGNSLNDRELNSLHDIFGFKEVKKPWEMTREEFSENYLWSGSPHPSLKSRYATDLPDMAASFAEQMVAIGAPSPGKTGQGIVRIYPKHEARFSTQNEYVLSDTAASVMELSAQEARSGHKSIIKKAIAEGKLVPPEVLKDYPDLKPHVEKLPVSQRPTISDTLDKADTDMAIKRQIVDTPVDPNAPTTRKQLPGFKGSKIAPYKPTKEWYNIPKAPDEAARYFVSDAYLLEKKAGDTGKQFVNKMDDATIYHNKKSSNEINSIERTIKSKGITDDDITAVDSYRKQAEKLTNSGLSDAQADALVDAQVEQSLTKLTKVGHPIAQAGDFRFIQWFKQQLKNKIVGQRLTKEQAEQYLASRNITLTPRQKVLNDEIGNAMINTSREANSAGVKVIIGSKKFTIPENFYYNPMVFKTGIFQDEIKMNNLFNRMVAKGYASNVYEAADILKQQQQFTKLRNPNLERPRWLDWEDVEDLVLPPKERIYAYLNKAYQRIGVAKEFGANDEIANTMIQDMERKGLDSKFTRSTYDYFTGKEKSIKSRLFDNLTALTVGLKMPFSALSEFNQRFVNSIGAAGLRDTVKALYKWNNKEGRQLMRLFAEDAGVLHQNIMEDMFRYLNLDEEAFMTKFARRSLNLYRFPQVHENNLIFAASVGKNYLTRLERRLIKNPKDSYARWKIKDLFNINPDKAMKGLNEEDLMYGAKQFVNKTQFDKSTYKVPYHWTHDPAIRLTTLFKSFSFRQTAFLKKIIWDEIQHGNVKPLLYISTALPLVMGEGKNFIVKTIKGIQDGENVTAENNPILDRYISDLAATGSLGMFTDIYWGANRPSGVLSTFAGPTLTSLGEHIAGVAKLKSDPNTLGRVLLRDVPVIGSRLQKEFLSTKRQLKFKEQNKPMFMGGFR